MKPIVAALRIVLGNTFMMYFKSASYHWNVEGKNFAEYHQFFGDLYEELFASIDMIAEHIRTCDDYAPVSIEELYTYKTIQEDTGIIVNQQKFANLLAANDQVVQSLNKLFEIANAEKNQGLMNFVADRLDIHAKHAWMIRSLSKSGE